MIGKKGDDRCFSILSLNQAEVLFHGLSSHRRTAFDSSSDPSISAAPCDRAGETGPSSPFVKEKIRSTVAPA